MDDFWYPHTVTITARSQAVDPDTKLAGNLGGATTVTLTADLQRQTTDEALTMFGLDLKNPAALFVALGSRGQMKVNDKVSKGADIFTVAGDPIVKDDGLGLDHCVFPLEGLQVTQ